MARFGGRTAFLRRGEWISADPELEQRLNAATKAWIQQTGGPPVIDRDHEGTTAREITEKLDGRVIRRVAPSLKTAAEIYISRRQLDLDFS